MTRSLYTRVVLIFLVAVIGGTLISYFLSTRLFREQLEENLQLPLRYLGMDIIRLYDTLPADEAETYISGMKQLQSHYIRIYDESGRYRAYGEQEGYSPGDISEAQVRRVLDGESVQVNATGISTTRVGLPFAIGSVQQALFIDSKGPPSASFIKTWALNFMIYALTVGSLVMLAAAIFLVRPIQQLTRATRQIAGGDFEVKLDIRQRGELGVLARSFERMTRDLRQLEELRKQFVANVSHEMQSPLTSISGYAKALQLLPADDAARSRYLGIIVDEADRLSKLSDNLLKLSLLESESRQLQPTDYRLDEQLREVIIALEPKWAPRSIRFELELQTARITADQDLLYQVWTNIIGNSIKFSPDHSVIEVALRQEGQEWSVRITDHGIGILPADRERIFERFFKGDRSHSRTVGGIGSGIGLAVVRQIVSLHGGRIEVESEPGSGTSMIVTLPQEAAGRKTL